MLKCDEVLIEHNQLLTKSMLNTIAAMPHDILNTIYASESNGIVKGLEFIGGTVEQPDVILSPGVIKWQNKVYLLGKPFALSEQLRTKKNDYDDFDPTKEAQQWHLMLEPQEVIFADGIAKQIKRYSLSFKIRKEQTQGLCLCTFRWTGGNREEGRIRIPAWENSTNAPLAQFYKFNFANILSTPYLSDNKLCISSRLKEAAIHILQEKKCKDAADWALLFSLKGLSHFSWSSIVDYITGCHKISVDETDRTNLIKQWEAVLLENRNASIGEKSPQKTIKESNKRERHSQML